MLAEKLNPVQWICLLFMSWGKGRVNVLIFYFILLTVIQVKGAGRKSLLIYAFVQIWPSLAAELAFILPFVMSLSSSNGVYLTGFFSQGYRQFSCKWM